MPPRDLYLDHPKHVIWNVSSFVCVHILSQWNPPSGAVEIATVTTAPVLLSQHGAKLSACSFSLSKLVCVLSQKEVFVPFLPFCQSFSVEAPYILHALTSQTAFYFLSQQHNKLCLCISDIVDNK